MDYSDLPSRLAAVRDRIASACLRSGRDPAAVTVVAVTKTHPMTAVEAVLRAGVVDLAENRVQELEAKVDQLGRAGLRWHLIGHIQRNKARRAVELADLIHSVDSLRLAEKLSEGAVASGRVSDVLVQVNVSGEATKGGVAGDSAIEDIGRMSGLPGLRLLGLMTMAPLTDDDRIPRRVFEATRELSEKVSREVSGFEGRHLSMGMSGDFEAAIEEGATLVRLGTVLLGERG